MIKDYLKAISETSVRGDAREESYYPVLKSFLEKYCQSIGKSKIHITTLPKKTEAGNPDFRVWDGKEHIIGYIEAKDPSIEDLDRIEEGEQLRRYLQTFANLILTNFLEFRLYRNGERVDKAVIGRSVVLNKLKTTPPVEREDKLINLLNKFFSFSIPKVYSSRTLAVELAKRTRFLREIVFNEITGYGFDDNRITLTNQPLSKGKEDSPSYDKRGKGGVSSYPLANNLQPSPHNQNKVSRLLYGFYEAFKEYLIGSLTEAEFSDLYAQTITYGLFAARVRAENGFNRKLAYDNIPKTIGILRDLFRFVSSVDIPQQMEWIIDDISEVLAVTDISKILHEYFHEGKGTDPIIHFYETFLTEYDPKTREMRGVYYTPEPVVSYIVRSLHIILKEKFNKPDGFADRDVTVLDPSAGTLTFLAEATKIAISEFTAKYGEGNKRGFIKEHILKNFYAFELMMAPYAIGHLKMSLLLEELGYKLGEGERIKLYLTNTLEMEELPETKLPGMSSLSRESHLAGMVKKEQPILVILGNPPYSVSSANKSAFIENEMRLYKEDVKSERNIQPLSDDYIKFVRFAQYKIEQDGKGIIGMITNNSYLSGLIHRGMRRKLINSFDEIYILNLHGSSRIGEMTPEGNKDENVFDIQQGVAISLFVKRDKESKDCKVYYQDVYGLRDTKYGYLQKHQVNNTRWKILKPKEPHYFFVKKHFTHQIRYERFLSVQDIFEKFSSGVKTHRDHFVVGFTEQELGQRIKTFVSDLPDEVIRQSFAIKDTYDFTLKDVRDKVRKSLWQELILPYSYRPFDTRYICYMQELIDRDRIDIMQHLTKKRQHNLVLTTTRMLSSGSNIFTHVFTHNTITDIGFLSSKTSETTYVFPLYLFKQSKPKKHRHLAVTTTLLIAEPEAEYEAKKPNFTKAFEDMISKLYKKTPTPEEIFYYIYGVLCSNTYRTRYAEFLRIDFPRVPFTKDYELFKKMSEYGNRLTDLHLLKSQYLNTPIAQFKVQGSNKVQKVRYDAGRVYINQEQYFELVPEEVWQYQVGGYQVCDKWLKDRKERVLSLDEIQTYCRIVTALSKTIEIQGLIDEIYDEVDQGN